MQDKDSDSDGFGSRHPPIVQGMVQPKGSKAFVARVRCPFLTEQLRLLETELYEDVPER